VTEVEPPKRKISRGVSRALWILLAVFIVGSVVWFFTERWFFETWSDLYTDELVYHLNVSFEGTNPDMIWDYVLHYLVPEIIVIGIMIGILFPMHHRWVKGRTKRVPNAWRVAIAVICVICCVLLGVASYDFEQRVGPAAYVASDFSSEPDFTEQHYADPSSVAIASPEHKRNLIYIYLESCEVTYADKASGGAFERNVIPELTRLSRENDNFSGADGKLDGGISLPGSTWTMGAMFAQSTGLPLKIPLFRDAMNHQTEFFPGTTAIGDILEAEGYEQELLIGSDAAFGGRDLFFHDHGDFAIVDYPYAIEHGWIPEDYLEFWGYEDEKLFANARKELARLAAGDKPFNLTLLTVDTHFEDGYKCRLCRNEFGEQYADAFACASRQVDAFIKWVQQQDFYEDTTIVICGDHPTMDVDFCEDVPEDYQRRTVTAVINSAVDPADPQRTRVYSTFDMFPTTLAAMGAQIEGDRLGLGTNLYGSRDTLVEELGVAECQEQLAGASRFLENFESEAVPPKQRK
jgi:phosphoglycerol transferase